MPEQREHLRCPACGAVRRGGAFGFAALDGHSRDLMVQHFVGGARGFVWERLPMERKHLVVLLEVLEDVVARLQAEIAEFEDLDD